MEKKLTVGNVCFIKDDEKKKVLFLRRAREPMQNMYTGVGGKTHFGEDINASCIREIKEETGLDVAEVRLRGVIKTILEGKDSSWLLFVYTATKFSGELITCNEGDLHWIDLDNIYSQNIIGFIRRILPHILGDDGFVEGTLWHDLKGNVLEGDIKRIS